MFPVQYVKKIKMKPRVGLMILAAGVMAGCASGTKSSIREEAREATGQVSKDYTERRADYIKKTETKLSDIRGDLNEFEKATPNSKVSNEDARDELKETRDKLSDVEDDFKDLKDADVADFDEERRDFVAEMNELESKYNKVRSYYR